MNTVKYRTSCAPFLAVLYLHQLAEDIHRENPIIEYITRQNFYVDGLIHGANTIYNICRIKLEVVEILFQGKFDLQKWCSNEASLVYTFTNLEFSKGKKSKTLRLVWNCQDDIHFLECECCQEICNNNS